MRIRDRMLVILSVSVLLLFLGGSLAYWRFFSSHLKQDEDALLASSVRGISQQVKERLRRYQGSVMDWAHWDETYAFLQGDRPDYVRDNLADGTFTALDISFFLLLDAEHRPRVQLQYDLQAGDSSPISARLLADLQQPERLLSRVGAGYILQIAPGESYFVAVSDVRDSQGSEPANGLLIIGRRLDRPLLSEWEDILGGRISIGALGGLEEELVRELAAISAAAEYRKAVRITGERQDTATIYLTFEQTMTADTPVFMLSKSRDAFWHGVTSMRLMLFAFAAMNILISLSMFALLRRAVYLPLADMDRELKRIDVRADKLEKLTTAKTPEMVTLGETLNGLMDRLSAERAMLRESERSKETILANLPGMAYRCLLDREYTMRFVSQGCYELTGYFPGQLIDNRDLSYNDLICPEYRDVIWDMWQEAAKTGTQLRLEYPIITAGYTRKWVFEQGQVIYDQFGHPFEIEGLIIDISLQKEREAEVRFISEHDHLTGLCNRASYDRALALLDVPDNLPLSVIMGDINGLKLVNDALGHDQGDKLLQSAAEHLKACSGASDFVARIGGDEFVILMPRQTAEEASALMQRVQEECRSPRYPADQLYQVSISLGSATKVDPSQSMHWLTKAAEDAMYKHKLLDSRSLHSSLVTSMQAALFERSQETGEHAARLVALSHQVAVRMQLNEEQLTNLELFARLHDIGKIGVNSEVLNKPGRLTPEEWVEMKKHSEIGYRIAMASPELTQIAPYVRSHHERWDGTGYPDGLAEHQIPLLSRILLVVDAYDAMTSDRPYRQAMAKAEAREEIRQNAGLQFDPTVVEVFLGVIDDKLTM